MTKSARTTDNGHGSALRVTLLPLTLTSHLIINPLDPNRVVLLTRWAILKLAIKNKITNKEREERVSLQNYNFFSLLVSRNTKNWTQKSYQELPRVLSCSKVFSAHCSIRRIVFSNQLDDSALFRTPAKIQNRLEVGITSPWLKTITFCLILMNLDQFVATAKEVWCTLYYLEHVKCNYLSCSYYVCAVYLSVYLSWSTYIYALCTLSKVQRSLQLRQEKTGCSSNVCFGIIQRF